MDNKKLFKNRDILFTINKKFTVKNRLDELVNEDFKLTEGTEGLINPYSHTMEFGAGSQDPATGEDEYTDPIPKDEDEDENEDGYKSKLKINPESDNINTTDESDDDDTGVEEDKADTDEDADDDADGDELSKVLEEPSMLPAKEEVGKQTEKALEKQKIRTAKIVENLPEHLKKFAEQSGDALSNEDKLLSQIQSGSMNLLEIKKTLGIFDDNECIRILKTICFNNGLLLNEENGNFSVKPDPESTKVDIVNTAAEASFEQFAKELEETVDEGTEETADEGTEETADEGTEETADEKTEDEKTEDILANIDELLGNEIESKGARTRKTKSTEVDYSFLDNDEGPNEDELSSLTL